MSRRRRRRGLPWRAAAGVALALLLNAGGASAQLVVSVAGGTGVTHAGLTGAETIGGLNAGISLPPLPHLATFWTGGGAFDSLAHLRGGEAATSLQAWLTTAGDAAHGRGAVLLGEAGLGRHWGPGLAGFSLFGAGAGWNFGGVVPFVEWQRRSGFHAGPSFESVVIGVHWVFFG